MILYSIESLWNSLQDSAEVHIIWPNVENRSNRLPSVWLMVGHRIKWWCCFMPNSSNSVFLWVLSSCFALLGLFTSSLRSRNVHSTNWLVPLIALLINHQNQSKWPIWGHVRYTVEQLRTTARAGVIGLPKIAPRVTSSHRLQGATYIRAWVMHVRRQARYASMFKLHACAAQNDDYHISYYHQPAAELAAGVPARSRPSRHVLAAICLLAGAVHWTA